MDKATEYLILQEADWSQVVNNLKIMIPNVERALLKSNPATLKKIAQKLKSKDFRDIERDAIRRIPGFKKDYAEAQRKVTRIKFVNNYTSKAAAMATALVSSVTKRDVDYVIKKGEMGVRNAKVLPRPGIFDLVMLGLFITVIIAIFTGDGTVILSALKVVLQTLALLFKMLGKIIIVLLTLLSKKGGAPTTPDVADTAGGFLDAASTPSGIPGDVGIINPDAIMDWVVKSLGS